MGGANGLNEVQQRLDVQEALTAARARDQLATIIVGRKTAPGSSAYGVLDGQARVHPDPISSNTLI